MNTNTVNICVNNEDIEVEVDWCYYAASGDGWNEPYIPAEIEVVALRLDGESWSPGDSVYDRVRDALEDIILDPY